MKTVTITSSRRPGFYRVKTDAFPGRGVFSPYPGCKWFPNEKEWLVPKEVWDNFLESNFKLESWHIRPTSRVTPLYEVPEGLLPHQRSAFIRAVNEPAWLLAFAMGLGKTRLSVKLLSAWGECATIVCPAVAREVWREELLRHFDEDSIQVIESGKQEVDTEAPITVVSYGLAQLAPSNKTLIVDEVHSVMNSKSQRSGKLRELREGATHVLGLTGTLTNDDPRTVWNIIELLWPGRAGKFSKWRNRYCEFRENSMGYPEVVGPKNTEELRTRLMAMGSFVFDVPGLPDIDIDTITDRPLESLLGENEPTLLLTHYIQTAEDTAEKLGIPCVHGKNSTSTKRVDKIRKAAEEHGACIVTIDSVSMAVDLSFFRRVLYLEPVHNLRTMMQSLGRFRRLNSTHPVEIRFVGHSEDTKFFAFGKKIAALNKTLKASETVEAAELALNKFTMMSEDEFMAALDAIMNTSLEVE